MARIHRARIDHKQCSPQEWMNMGEGDTELQSAILASLLNHIGSLQLQNERLRRELDERELDDKDNKKRKRLNKG